MKHIFWVLLVFIGFSYASAQDVYTSSGRPGYHKKPKKKKGYDPEKLIVGGGLILDFGSDYVLAGLSPVVGYRFTDHLSAGVGLGYEYFKVPDLDYYNPPYANYYDKGHIIYPSIWGRYFVWRNVYVTGTLEYDVISGTYPFYDVIANQFTDYKKTVNSESVLLGVGVKQPLGGRVSIFGQIQHEFLQQNYSPYYGQPFIVNFGIAAGL
jgi:hypothetical protein